MRRRTALLASCLTAVVVASTVVLPAFGAPSALTIARNALKTAKSADARSKVALATARKPGPAGAQGTQGAKGDPGSPGAPGTGSPGSSGAPGSTLKSQLTGPGTLTSVTGSPTTQTVSFTPSANRAVLAAISATVTPPPSQCNAGDPSKGISVTISHGATPIATLALSRGGAATPMHATSSVPADASPVAQDINFTAIDNCTDNTQHGTVTNMKVDVVEFAPAP